MARLICKDVEAYSRGRSVAESAASVLWAAGLPDDGPACGFFRDGLPIAF